MTNIVKVSYEISGDTTCSEVAPLAIYKDTRTYLVAQFTENVCTTKTATSPYKSILGTAYATVFPSFSNGILYKYYGTSADCTKDTGKNLAGIYWTDFNCKTWSRSIETFCYLGKASYNKFTDSTCSGKSPVAHSISSSCSIPVRTGTLENGYLASGTLYDYLHITCLGGLPPPVIQPSPYDDPY